MADIVHKGVESRVYVRFRGNPGPVDPSEHAALRKLQRAGARLDRDCGLWYVPKHQRDAAVSVVLETGGSVDPDPDDIPSEVWVKAPDGGELMRSWWVLTAAGPSGFWFLNPFLPDPGSAVVMTWEEARAAYRDATRPDVKAALAEIGKAAKRLAGIEDGPKSEKLFRKATARQVQEIASLMQRVMKEKPRHAAAYQKYLGQVEGVNGLNESQAADLIGRMSVTLRVRERDDLSDCPAPVTPGAGWGEKATEKQKNAINYTLHKLSKLDADAADTLEAKLKSLGDIERISKRDASRLIDEIGAAVEEATS